MVNNGNDDKQNHVFFSLSNLIKSNQIRTCWTEKNDADDYAAVGGGGGGELNIECG